MNNYNMIKSAMFGYFKDKYYRLEENGLVVIPANYDYKNKAISSVLDRASETGVIKVYQYHTDLTVENNKERVSLMQAMLLDEKITEMDDLNKDYVVCVSYEIYNKDNMLIKSGTSSVKAAYNTAYIMDNVSVLDELEYRKAMIFDGSIEIQIPEISRYGIKNKYTQHPYTVKISKISICTTIGEKNFLDEETSQRDYDNYAHRASITHHATPFMPKNNYGSHFVTNAKVGTTLIDQTVVSKVLDTDVEFKLIELASIDCNSNEFITKFDSKLKMINVDIEVIVDNCNMVFNQDDVLNILESNDEEENPPIEHPPVDHPTDDPDDINKDDKPSTDNPSENPPSQDTPVENPDDNKDTPIETPSDNPSTENPSDNDNPSQGTPVEENPSEETPDDNNPSENPPSQGTPPVETEEPVVTPPENGTEDNTIEQPPVTEDTETHSESKDSPEEGTTENPYETDNTDETTASE